MKALNLNQFLAKHELKTLSTKERSKFYFQELLQGQIYFRKYFIALIILFCFGQIPNLITYTFDDSQDSTPICKWLLLGFFILAVFCLFTSSLIRFKKECRRTMAIQFLLLLIGNIFAFCFIVLGLHVFIRDAMLDISAKTLMDGMAISAAGLYVTRLMDLFTPFWYLRMIAPSAYFIGWLINAYQFKDHPGLLPIWLSCAVGVFNIILVNWVHGAFRWKLFVKRIDNEKWNEIHKLILDRVPSPIAAFNIQGSVIYTNLEFTKLLEDHLDLQKIIKLRIRKHQPDIEAHSIHLDLSEPAIHGGNGPKPKTLPKVNQQRFTEEVEDLTKLLEIARELLQNGEIDDQEHFVFDGKLDAASLNKNIFFEVTVSFMVEYQKIILILKDTTNHVRLVAAEINNEYKDKLLASVSHELRTPLNGNLSLIETAISDPDTPQKIKEKFLTPAYRSGKLLLHLINDILDYSQITAKKLRLNFEKLSIKETIMSCFQLLELQAKKKGVKLKLLIFNDIILFTTDHDRLRQIILNLMSNALKFTFNGSITLKARMISDSSLKITVKDTGIGIKPEDLSKLFKEFTRIDDPNQVGINAKGVGLGLTIANKLAKRLAPSRSPEGISVKSVYGTGSTFGFVIVDKNKEKLKNEQESSIERLEGKAFFFSDTRSLSLPSIEQDRTDGNIEKYFGPCTSKERVEYPTRLMTSRKKKRVLIVDDDPFNILAIEAFLKEYGLEMEAAFNGKEAVEKVTASLENNQEFDIIFMDCQMPIMDGYQATRMLRRLDKRNNNENVMIPIIGCTAFNGKECIDLCHACGMTHVLKKPLSKADVEQIIKQIL